MARPLWSGTIQISLVGFAVDIYPATSTTRPISFQRDRQEYPQPSATRKRGGGTTPVGRIGCGCSRGEPSCRPNIAPRYTLHRKPGDMGAAREAEGSQPTTQSSGPTL